VVPFEVGRYWVQVGQGGRYLVDLAEYDGNGWCGCMQFQCRHQPELERSTSVMRRCKHLLAAVMVLPAMGQGVRL
jgi:hypothetical protein